MNRNLNYVAGLLMMIALTVFACLFSVDAEAASKTYRDLSDTETTEDNMAEVGDWYFYMEDGSVYMAASDIEVPEEIAEDVSGSFITNGTYCYYVKDDTIYRYKISSGKTSRIHYIGEDSDVIHVYSNSIYYAKESEEGETQIHCYNKKKGKDRVILKHVDDLSFNCYGKYMTFVDSRTGYLRVRNCSKGKNYTICKEAAYYVRCFGKKVLYVTNVNDTDYVMSYRYSTKKNTALAEVNPAIEDAAFTSNAKKFCYLLEGSYYKLNLTTKNVKVIEAEDFQDIKNNR